MQIDLNLVKQVLDVLVRASSYYDTYAEIAALEKALTQPDHVAQTFEEFLANDEGVRLFGLELKDEWIDAARVGWEAAMRAKQENV